MLAPTVALLVVGLAAGVPAPMRHGVDRAATAFTDRPAYAQQVLHDGPPLRPHGTPASGPHGTSVLYALAGVAGAVALAGASLGQADRRRAPSALRRPVELLHAWHDGHVGDYATWAAAGAAALGWILAAAVR
jgi:multicomponent Na+:H+ antiporter subunit D